MLRAFAVAGLLTVALAASNLMGDEKKEAPRARGALPAHWSKLGLNDEQRQKVYTVQTEYRAKIDDLRREIRELERKQRGEMEKVLTDAQKARLRELITEKIPGGSVPKDDSKSK